MPKVREPESGDEAHVDMTPMIDVTFLLIIFFVTIQQLTVLEVATRVTLPRASQANPESAEDKDRLIVSVDYDGRCYVANEPQDMDQLSQLLKREAETGKRDAEGYSTRTIFIRADITAPYGIVQDIMTKCREQDIYRLAFRVQEWKK